MAEIGELFMKIAGRDAGKICVVIDVLDERFVMIDGQTRRRKCNIFHLEPINKTIKVSKNATHEAISKVFKSELNIELVEKKKSKKATTRPKKQKFVKKQGKKASKTSSVKKVSKKSDTKKDEKSVKKSDSKKETKTEDVDTAKKK